ncbi:hypothetical protein PIB30_098246 [Stylosanthes scabra]|uniref:Uncharacterized protein n=1 Tax=Stylosanthes scabra TaxID=79078 RepID=A0ABU6RWR0_9FABA|nr:hypothetical protein [Stylosanthes scabra]
MSTTHRLLLYMVSYVLLPRKRNHGTATEEDLPIIWAMAQEKQINWPYLIAHKMVKYSRGAATVSLGHAHLWTRILESLDVDLTRERVIEPSKVNAIVQIQDLRGEFRSFRDSFQRSGHQEQQDPTPGQD